MYQAKRNRHLRRSCATVDHVAGKTNMKADFATYNRVYAEYFAGEGNPNPTRTTIAITALPTPIAVEVKVIAAIE